LQFETRDAQKEERGVGTNLQTLVLPVRESPVPSHPWEEKETCMMRKQAVHYFLLVIIFFFLLHGVVRGEAKLIGFAIPFPDLTFKHILSKGEQTYLGIPQKKLFSFREIRGSLLLIEFLSTYCHNCQKQAPIFNEVYASVEKDPELKERVKIIGIAAGNNLTEVEQYKKEYKIPYPILPDSKFVAHNAVGSPRTPFTIWVRKDSQGKGVVVSTHLGPFESAMKAIEETKAVLQYDLALLKPKSGLIYEGDALKPPLSEEELLLKVKEGMETLGGKVLELKKIILKDGDLIYIGKVDFGTHQKNLFSKLASRRAVCDICHDTFFFYTFDSEGKVVDILPIQLTKIDNLNWTGEDIKKLKNRVLGRSIFKPFAFDPKVDSISGATITAILIFDSLEKAKEIYEKMRKEGYIRN
jgi:thiol-disulfide isomerase/thioredoxin